MGENLAKETGDLKYIELAPVVKTCLSIHNGNASCERSLSDNKNMLTAERTNLSEETMGLRRAKEHCREMKWAHNVDAQEKSSNSYAICSVFMNKEKKKNELKKRLEADKLEEQKRQQEQLKKVNKKRH